MGILKKIKKKIKSTTSAALNLAENVATVTTGGIQDITTVVTDSIPSAFSRSVNSLMGTGGTLRSSMDTPEHTFEDMDYIPSFDFTASRINLNESEDGKIYKPFKKYRELDSVVPRTGTPWNSGHQTDTFFAANNIPYYLYPSKGPDANIIEYIDPYPLDSNYSVVKMKKGFRLTAAYRPGVGWWHDQADSWINIASRYGLKSIDDYYDQGFSIIYLGYNLLAEPTLYSVFKNIWLEWDARNIFFNSLSWETRADNVRYSKTVYDLVYKDSKRDISSARTLK